MPIPPQFIDELNRDTDIVGLISQQVELKKAGTNYKGLCPFHHEKTPSFSVNPAKNFYYCFGCQASGNPIGFVMQTQGCSFVEAVEQLAAKLGREVPRSGGHRARPGPAKLLEDVADAYHRSLLKNETAKDYLKGRGLGKEVVKRYRLGYAAADGGLGRFARTKGAAKELLAAGLQKRGDDGRTWCYFRNRIMFPITTTAGKVAGFGGRLLEQGEPKYLNSPQSDSFDKSAIVYGLAEAAQAIHKHKAVIVTEGYMDVVALAQHGIANAVATMGTAATSRQIQQIISRSDEIVFCFDGDSAGKTAAQRVLGNLLPVMRDGKRVRFVILPDGADPDDIVAKRGADHFKELVASAQLLEEFMFAAAKEANDVATSSELWRELTALIETIDPKKAAYAQKELYKRLMKVSGIPVTELRKAHRASRPRTQGGSPPVARDAAGRTMKDAEIYQLLCCLKLAPELAARVATVPLVSEKNTGSDILLVREVVQLLAHAEDIDGPAPTVESYLEGKKARALLAQISATTAKWHSSGLDVGKKVDKIIATMEKHAAKQLRKEEMRVKL